MTGAIPVLDHGSVRLVDHMGSDLAIARAARVSYNADARAGTDQGSDARLIRYLWAHKHTSPFEAVTFTFEIEAPIFVFRQWHRHRTWSFNEISARYAELPETFYVPDAGKIGTASPSSKQARLIPEDEEYTLDTGLLCRRVRQTEDVRAYAVGAFKLYRSLLEEGWPRELARTVLPVSTYSRMFATVDLLNLLKFLSLRSHQHAQYEIRVYADAMLKLIEPVVPAAVAAWRAACP